MMPAPAMWKSKLPLAIAGIVASCALTTSEARAESPSDVRTGDGAYGRFDGDWTFVAGAGVGTVASPGQGFATFDLRARYLETVGIAVAYDETFARRDVVGGTARALTTSVELRPLFLPRFLQGHEVDGAFGDLVLDSLGLEIGARFADRTGLSSTHPGLMVGTAIELPLMSQASGLWLRMGASVRWTAQELAGDADPGGRTVAFTLGLAFHQIVYLGTVDARDHHIF